MEIKTSTLKNLLYGIVAIVVLGGVAMLMASKPSEGPKEFETPDTTIDLEGKQVLNLTAKGGYSPAVITAKAGEETVLVVTTKNTFDCSSAFVIPSLKIQKNLPASGTTQFILGTFEAGKEINGSCSMGMYNFKIKFV
jgi:plastocyanin domain-containing protein